MRYYNEFTDYSEDYLAHYGRIGQKWGIRQFQNKDGSLTQAGRVHYGVGEARKKTAEGFKKLVKKVKSNKAKAKREAALKKARIQKQKLAKVKERVKSSAIAARANSDKFSTIELQELNKRYEALNKLESHANNEAQRFNNKIKVGLEYAKSAKDIYDLLSSDTVQAMTREFNAASGANLPYVPKSYDDFTKLYGNAGLTKFNLENLQQQQKKKDKK